MTSSNGSIFRVTGPLCGEFTGHRWIPLTKASDAELWFLLNLRLNKRLSKHSRGWWFETPSRPLWRQCNAATMCAKLVDKLHKMHARILVSAQNKSTHKSYVKIHMGIDKWVCVNYVECLIAVNILMSLNRGQRLVLCIINALCFVKYSPEPICQYPLHIHIRDQIRIILPY